MKSIALHFTLLFSILLLKGLSANENSPWLEEKFVNQKSVGLSKLEGSNPAQWRVIWKTDPAHKATVSWTTASQGKNHVVHYDLKSKKGLSKNYTFKKVADRNGLLFRFRRRAFSSCPACRAQTFYDLLVRYRIRRSRHQ